MTKRVMMQSFDWRSLKRSQQLRARHADDVPDGPYPQHSSDLADGT